MNEDDLQTSIRTSESPAVGFATEHEAIVATMQHYVSGGRAGKSELMKPTFHRAATIVGYCGGVLLTGPIQQLFDWTDQNGPATDIKPRFAAIEVLNTIPVVRLEVENWTGALAGATANMLGVFNFLKTGDGWQIVQKAFHWHTEPERLV